MRHAFLSVCCFAFVCGWSPLAYEEVLLQVTVSLTLPRDALLPANGDDAGLAETLALVFSSLGHAGSEARMDSAEYTVTVSAVPPLPVQLPGQCFLFPPANDGRNDTTTNTTYNVTDSRAFCVVSGAACDCIPGYYYYDEECVACAAGKFKADYGAATECVPCAAGWFTAGGQGACWPCPPNTASPAAGAAECAPCAEHSEAPEYGSAACLCVAGTAADYAGVSCVPCRPGQYQPQTGGQCLVCEGYTTSIVAGATACDVCGAGAHGAGCEPCPAGSFLADECTACPAGQYAELPGATACVRCGYQPHTGASACMECVHPEGAVPDAAGGACVCPPGTELDYSGAACAPCHPGFYQPLSAAACAPCPGYSTNSAWGASACDLCIEGAGRLAAECAPCPPGFFVLAGEECAPCPAGAYAPYGGATVCLRCSLSAVVAATECAPCVDGWVLEDGDCAPCAPGTFSAGGVACAACADDTYAAVAGLSACQLCPEYTAAGRGAIACYCAAGTVSDYLNRRCVPCPPGSAAWRGGGVCDACPTGTYSPLPAATACLACPNGTEAPFFDGATACIDCTLELCRCPAGEFNSSGRCAPCSTRCPLDAHYIQTRCTPQADIECAPCSAHCGPGDFFMSEACSIDADAVCSRCRSTCPPAFYVAGPCTPSDDAPCAPCAAGCRNDSFVKTPCGGASDLVCEPCPQAGTFTDDGGACRSCDAGTVFVDNGGCVACPHGAYSNAQRTACVPHCPAGALTFFLLIRASLTTVSRGRLVSVLASGVQGVPAHDLQPRRRRLPRVPWM